MLNLLILDKLLLYYEYIYDSLKIDHISGSMPVKSTNESVNESQRLAQRVSVGFVNVNWKLKAS